MTISESRAEELMAGWIKSRGILRPEDIEELAKLDAPDMCLSTFNRVVLRLEEERPDISFDDDWNLVAKS